MRGSPLFLLALSQQARAIFEADFSEPLRDQFSYPEYALFDTTTKSLVTGQLATARGGAMLMTGTNAGAIWKVDPFKTGDTWGAYSVQLSWSPGYLVPMDEAVQTYLCNIPPESFEARVELDSRDSR